MRLGTLSTLAMIIGLTLSACGGESVEDRARALKSARKPAEAPADSAMPMATAPSTSSSASAAPAPAPLPPP